MACGSLGLLLVGIVALHDGVRVGLSHRASTEPANQSYLVRAGLVGVLCVILLASLAIREFHITQRRSQFVSLDLPGAQRLKLAPDRANAIRTVVEKINRHADTFIFAENTRNSFYFWTQQDPPTAINATAWPYMIGHDQQLRIVEALERFDRVVVLRDQQDWPLPHDSPLLNWIDQNFVENSTDGAFRFWTHRSHTCVEQVSVHEHGK